MRNFIPFIFFIFFGFMVSCDGESTKKVDSSSNNFLTQAEYDERLKFSGTFTDSRDSQNYKWVRLKDGKKWMAQNLNYKISDSYCYNNDSVNCKKYGRLYTWEAAKKACPNGWRLPTDREWWKMTSYYGKPYNDMIGQLKNQNSDSGKAAYKALIQGGNSGFSALLGGYYSFEGDFFRLGSNGHYWSSAEESSSNAWGYYFFSANKRLNRSDINRTVGRSCRCLQD